MTPKQLQNAMIKRNNKSAYTKPEQDFERFCREKGFIFQQDVSEWFVHDLKRFQFQMDFIQRNRFGEIEVDIEIDGKGHKEKWDHWKDEIKTANGIKVIHIGADLCKRKYWDYLSNHLNWALKFSPDMVVYIYE